MDGAAGEHAESHVVALRKCVSARVSGHSRRSQSSADIFQQLFRRKADEAFREAAHSSFRKPGRSTSGAEPVRQVRVANGIDCRPDIGPRPPQPAYASG